MTLTSAFADENGGGAEWIMAGKHVADFGDFPTTGQSFELRAASMMLVGRLGDAPQRLLVGIGLHQADRS